MSSTSEQARHDGAPAPQPDNAPHTVDELGFKPQIKAASAKRANASIIGMVLAVVVTAAIAMILPLMSTHPAGQLNRPDVNVADTAEDAAGVAGFTPLAPELPQGWSVNYARWNSPGQDGVGYWDVGYTTDKQKFVQLLQTKQANPTWLNAKTDGAAETGTRTVAGTQFKLLDKPGTSTSLVGAINGTTAVFRSELSDGNDFSGLDTLVTDSLKTTK